MQTLEDSTNSRIAQDAWSRYMRSLPPLDGLEVRPDVIDRLEELDDVIFAAIDGDPEARKAAATVWHEAQHHLGCENLEESRRQYLRRANHVWHVLRDQTEFQPGKSVAAIEIVLLLSEDSFSLSRRALDVDAMAGKQQNDLQNVAPTPSLHCGSELAQPVLS